MRLYVNGAELEVNQYADNGEAIIFLHFSRGNLAQWNGIVPQFIDNHQVVAMDLRGHGKSEKVQDGYTLENMAADVIGVMDKLDIDKAHIIGSSLGGEIAVVAAARFPERILSIVAEGAIQSYFGKNGVWDIPEDEIPNKKQELRIERKNRLEPVYDSIAQKLEQQRMNYEQNGIQWNQEIEEFELYGCVKTEKGKYTLACPKWVVDKYIEDYWDIKFEQYFEKIKCPVLMLPSEEEWASEEAKASTENFQRLLEFSKVEVIPGGQHAYVVFQYPQEFSKAILEFYKEIE